MVFLKSNILVKELQADFVIDGLIEKYDDSSPVMYGTIIDVSEEIRSKLTIYGELENTVLMFKRVAKIPVLGGYLVNYDDVIALMSIEEYNKLKGGL